MKKILSFFLTLMMVLTLACSVSATEETGSITIKGVALDTDDNPDTDDTLGTRVYSVYKLLDLESYVPGKTEEEGIYSYKVSSKWEGFFAPDGDGARYFTH